MLSDRARRDLEFFGQFVGGRLFTFLKGDQDAALR